jgi:hypothetical protein
MTYPQSSPSFSARSVTGSARSGSGGASVRGLHSQSKGSSVLPPVKISQDATRPISAGNVSITSARSNTSNLSTRLRSSPYAISLSTRESKGPSKNTEQVPQSARPSNCMQSARGLNNSRSNSSSDPSYAEGVPCSAVDPPRTPPEGRVESPIQPEATLEFGIPEKFEAESREGQVTVDELIEEELLASVFEVKEPPIGLPVTVLSSLDQETDKEVLTWIPVEPMTPEGVQCTAEIEIPHFTPEEEEGVDSGLTTPKNNSYKPDFIGTAINLNSSIDMHAFNPVTSADLCSQGTPRVAKEWQGPGASAVSSLDYDTTLIGSIPDEVNIPHDDGDLSPIACDEEFERVGAPEPENGETSAGTFIEPAIEPSTTPVEGGEDCGGFQNELEETLSKALEEMSKQKSVPHYNDVFQAVPMESGRECQLQESEISQEPSPIPPLNLSVLTTEFVEQDAVAVSCRSAHAQVTARLADCNAEVITAPSPRGGKTSCLAILFRCGKQSRN